MTASRTSSSRRATQAGRCRPMALDHRLRPGLPDGRESLASYIDENQRGKKVGILYESNELRKRLRLRPEKLACRPGIARVRAAVRQRGPGHCWPYRHSFPGRSRSLRLGDDCRRPPASAITAAHGRGYNPQLVLSYVNSQTQLATRIGGGAAPDQLSAGFRELRGAVFHRLPVERHRQRGRSRCR